MLLSEKTCTILVVGVVTVVAATTTVLHTEHLHPAREDVGPLNNRGWGTNAEESLCPVHSAAC